MLGVLLMVGLVFSKLCLLCVLLLVCCYLGFDVYVLVVDVVGEVLYWWY